VQQVVDHVPDPADDAAAAGVERPLDRRGVADQGVGRGQGADQGVRGEPGAFDVPPVGAGGFIVVDQAGQRLAEGDVGLRHAPVRRVGLPRRVGEALVPVRRSDAVGAADDLHDVPAHPGRLAGEGAGPGDRGEQSACQAACGRDGYGLGTVQRHVRVAVGYRLGSIGDALHGRHGTSRCPPAWGSEATPGRGPRNRSASRLVLDRCRSGWVARLAVP
jgi:hypothetical protein